MDLEQRIVKLEKSNKNYKIILAVCICMFMVSAKDIFIKDKIKAKKIIVDEITIGNENHHIVLNGTSKTVINKCEDFWSKEWEMKHDQEGLDEEPKCYHIK